MTSSTIIRQRPGRTCTDWRGSLRSCASRCQSDDGPNNQENNKHGESEKMVNMVNMVNMIMMMMTIVIFIIIFIIRMNMITKNNQ